MNEKASRPAPKRRASALRESGATRERILQAAMLRFARHSYEQVGLRRIAADVGIDVAYVHRCFGSKERLFEEALRAAIGPSRPLAVSAPELAAEMTRQLFARDAAYAAGQVTPLDIAIRSLSSAGAAPVLRRCLLRDFVAPLSCGDGLATPQRAALVAAFLAGIGILRNVLRVRPLLETAGGELEAAIVRIVGDIFGARPAPARLRQRETLRK